MSVLIRSNPTSPMTKEQYNEAARRLQEAGDFPPDGLEIHVCFVADGNLRVSEVWDSREQIEAFRQRLMPLLAEMGVDPGEPEMFEVHNIIRR